MLYCFCWGWWRGCWYICFNFVGGVDFFLLGMSVVVVLILFFVGDGGVDMYFCLC